MPGGIESTVVSLDANFLLVTFLFLFSVIGFFSGRCSLWHMAEQMRLQWDIGDKEWQIKMTRLSYKIVIQWNEVFLAQSVQTALCYVVIDCKTWAACICLWDNWICHYRHSPKLCLSWLLRTGVWTKLYIEVKYLGIFYFF